MTAEQWETIFVMVVVFIFGVMVGGAASRGER